MRQIKFRAKRKNGDKWVFGTGIVQVQKNTYDRDEWEIMQKVNYDELDSFIPLYETERIDIKTLGQYIGLKDCNGTEIYEGDILEYILRNVNGEEISREYYLVKECINGWELRNIKRPKQHKSLKFCFKYKIIGNIYKNPNLLEAGD